MPLGNYAIEENSDPCLPLIDRLGPFTYSVTRKMVSAGSGKLELLRKFLKEHGQE